MKKKFLILIIFGLLTSFMFAQQKVAKVKYTINPCVKSQDTVFFKIKDKIVKFKKNWILTETIGGKVIQRKLDAVETDTVKIDSIVIMKSKWYAGEVIQSEKDPSILKINPWIFKADKDSLLNNKAYIKIPANSYVTLKKEYWKWSAITIPFAIRPALNDTIGSKITADLKIGASFSRNIDWERFRNRRIKGLKSSYGVSLGVGFGFSKVTLDEDSTSLDSEPLTNSEDGLAFFITPGIGINIKGFQIAGFFGYDIGLTDNVNKWNYNNKHYFGIGLGVDLATFGKIE